MKILALTPFTLGLLNQKFWDWDPEIYFLKALQVIPHILKFESHWGMEKSQGSIAGTICD